MVACGAPSVEKDKESLALEATPAPQGATQNVDNTYALWEEFCLLTCGTGAPDSADGVDVSIGFFSAKRDIKYATFYVSAYNSVDDAVSCEIKGTHDATLKVTGPITPGIPYLSNFENVWYNPTISYMKIGKIEIEFTDGTIYTTENPQAIAGGGIGVSTSSTLFPFEVYREPLQDAVNKILKEKGMSSQDFVSKYSELYPDYEYAQDLIAEESYLNSYPWILSVEHFSQCLGTDPIELLHTLTEYDVINDKFFITNFSGG